MGLGIDFAPSDALHSDVGNGNGNGNGGLRRLSEIHSLGTPFQPRARKGGDEDRMGEMEHEENGYSAYTTSLFEHMDREVEDEMSGAKPVGVFVG